MLEVAQNFLELLLCGSKQEHIASNAHIREAVLIVVSWANTHSPFLLPAWKVVFQGHLEKNVEEQARQLITLLGPFFISNMSLSSSVITVAFGFLYSLFKRLMYSCSIPHVLRTSQIELGVMESNAFMECFRESTSLSPSACLSTGKLFLNFRWTCVVLLDITLLAPFCVSRTCL